MISTFRHAWQALHSPRLVHNSEVSACRSLFIQNRSLITSSEHLLTSAAKSTTGVTVCSHAPGSCILCTKNAAPAGKNFFGRYFSTGDSSSPSKDQQSETTSKTSGRKESTSVGTEGGMLVHQNHMHAWHLHILPIYIVVIWIRISDQLGSWIGE